MMQGLKNRTRKALGLRKKDKETDTTSSPDKEATGSSKRGSKKANGAPNGFYGEIDWDRYASPDVDEEGFSLRPGEKGDASKGKHFYSSSDSDDEGDSKKKFKIKIKPLTTSSTKCIAPSMDELKASVGGLALSPSLRRSPGQMKRNLSCEEIARPRRSTPTPSPAPETPSDRMSQNAHAFFGHPTDYDYARYDVVQTVTWGEPRPRPESPLTRGFPTGAPPPLPPKNIPSTSHYGYPSDSSAALPNGRVSHSPAPVYLNVQSPASYRRCPAPPVAPDDDVFTPAPPPWVTFSGERRPPPPDEPAPPPPPPESPPPATPPSSSSSPSTPPRLSPGPPPEEPPPSPPPFSPLTPCSPPDSPPSIVLGPPPEEPAPPLPADFSPSNLPPLCLDDTEDEEVLELARYAPTSPAPPLPPGAGTTPSPSSLLGPPCGKRLPLPLEELPDHVGAGCFRGTPPPLPPTTYRSIGSSPGPSGSGTSSPVRPATPQSGGSPVPPPPPPRPSSRPKLPPGKPISDLARPFSPPVSSSPPPFAPLARAESSSSISSITSHSAASTPTLGRDLNMSSAEGPQPLVWFDHGRFFLAFEACSRGPSPLTMGTQDTLPVAAAFTETINAYFKGADPSKCVVKIMGEMVLSFPAGITRHFSSQPTQPVLTFTISNYRRLEQVLPNPQLLCCDSIADSGETKEFWVNMPNLMSHLKRVAEQKPQATYYNVDMIKYQVSGMGIQSTPLNLAVSWRGDANSTDLRIDYKYNTEAMAAPVPLHNIQFLVQVDGGVAQLQAMMPSAAWNPEQQTMLWKINCLSHRSDNGGVGALLGRFQLTAGPSRPSQVAVQFSGEGSTLSGCDIQLVGAGYRLSLVKKRFAAGKYLADN